MTIKREKTTSKTPVITELVSKEKGRPLMLGIEMDKAVQEYINSTRAAAGVVNTANSNGGC